MNEEELARLFHYYYEQAAKDCSRNPILLNGNSVKQYATTVAAQKLAQLLKNEQEEKPKVR